MRVLVLAVMLALGAAAAVAETRFMRLNHDTVAGRKVTTENGNVFMFHRDGRYQSVVRGDRVRDGRWAISNENVIKVDLDRGYSVEISSHRIDGEQHLRFLRYHRRSSGPHRNKIIKIEPID